MDAYELQLVESLVDAEKELSWLNAKLEDVRAMCYAEQVREAEFAVRYYPDRPSLEDAKISAQAVINLFGWDDSDAALKIIAQAKARKEQENEDT